MKTFIASLFGPSFNRSQGTAVKRKEPESLAPTPDDSLSNAGRTREEQTNKERSQLIKLASTLLNAGIAIDEATASGQTIAALEKLEKKCDAVADMEAMKKSFRSATGHTDPCVFDNALVKIFAEHRHFCFDIREYYFNPSSLMAAFRMEPIGHWESLSIDFDDGTGKESANSLAHGLELQKVVNILAKKSLKADVALITPLDQQLDELKRSLESLKKLRLTRLKLICDSLSEEDFKALVELIKTSKTLQALDLSGIRFESEQIKQIADALTHSKTLTELKLAGCTHEHQPGVVNELAKIINRTAITDLDVSNNVLTAQDLRALSSALMNKKCKLKTLNIRRLRAEISDDNFVKSAVKLMQSTANQTLNKLNVCGLIKPSSPDADQKIQNAIAEAIADPNSALVELEIGPHQDQAGLCNILSKVAGSNLTHLGVIDSQLDNLAMAVLGNALHHEKSSVTNLNLSGSTLSLSIGYAFLRSFPEKLTQLNLSKSNVWKIFDIVEDLGETDEVDVLMAGLIKSNLQHLNLKVELSSAAREALKKSMPESKLQSLQLSGWPKDEFVSLTADHPQTKINK